MNSGKNFSFIFGCQAGEGVNANSEFIADTIKLIITHFDQEKGEITIPDIYSNVVSSDAKFEVVTRVDAKKLVLER